MAMLDVQMTPAERSETIIVQLEDLSAETFDAIGQLDGIVGPGTVASEKANDVWKATLLDI